MNLENYEETRLPKACAMCSTCLLRKPADHQTLSFFAQDTWAKYLKEGMNVNLLTWNGKASAWNISSSASRLSLMVLPRR